MNTRRILIFDLEEGYANALSACFQKKKELNLQIEIKTEKEKTIRKDNNESYYAVFSGTSVPLHERMEISAKFRFLLTETGNEAMDETEVPIFKFQAGEKILREFIHECCESGGADELFLRLSGKGQTNIIGVFSPIGRIGKTGYALKLGEDLAKNEQVLYLNMELFGGYGGHFHESPENTLADVFYCLRQEKQNIGLRIATFVSQKNSLNYLAPMTVSKDVKEVKAAEWLKLIRIIMEECSYQSLILDMSEGIDGLYEILKICKEIHMPVINGEYAQAKVNQFKAELMLMKMEEVLENIREIPMRAP
ncbi:MAG: hypothetical protein LBQ95_08465 [Lachnospiraceae bacterium]|nr:hypothetical protein [Lachnospiraceae bacterium]